MAEIITEIIILKKYKFCNDIWGIIKEYMGVFGIDIRIPDFIKSVHLFNLSNFNNSYLGLQSRQSFNKGVEVKAFYNAIRLKNKIDILYTCDSLIKSVAIKEFKIPNDLVVGEDIIFYQHYFWDTIRILATVIKINNYSFTVRRLDNNKIKIIRSNNYLRRSKANPNEILFFNTNYRLN